MNLTFITAFISTFLFLRATSSPIPPQTHLQPSNIHLSVPYDASNDFLHNPSSHSDFQAASGDFPKTSPDNLNESIERTVTIAIAPAFRAFYPKPEYEVKVKSLANLSKWTPEELMPIVAMLKPSWVAAKANKYGELNSALYVFERQMRAIGVPIFPRSERTGETPIEEEGGVFQIQTPPLPKAIEIPLGPQSLDIPPSLQKFCGKKILKFTARKLMTKEDLKPVREVLEQLWDAAKEGGDSVLCGDIQHFETRLIHRHVPIVTHKARTSGSLSGMIIKPARLYSWKKDHTRKKTASRAARSKNASVIQPPEPLAPPLNTTPMGTASRAGWSNNPSVIQPPGPLTLPVNTTPLAITPHTEPSFQPPPAAAAHWQVSPTAMQQDTQSGHIGYGYYQSGQAGYAGGFNLGLAVGHTDLPSEILTPSGGLPPPQSFDDTHYDLGWNDEPDYGWKDLKTPPHLYGDNVMGREAVSQEHSPGAPALALPGGLAHSEYHALFTGWNNHPGHGRQTLQTPPHGFAAVPPPSTDNNDKPRSSGTGSFSWGHQH